MKQEIEGTQRKPTRDKILEQQELRAILTQHTQLQGDRAVLLVPHAEGTPLTYSLTSQAARSWVFSQYAASHQGIIPLLQSYKLACLAVYTSLLDAISPGEEEEQESNVREPSKAEKLEMAVREHCDWIRPAIDARAEYARVYEPVEVRGLYRLDGYRTCRLTDAYGKIYRVTRPQASSRFAHYSTIYAGFCNDKGEIRYLSFTNEQILTDELANKLVAFASYPRLDVQRRYLSEALALLSREEGTQVQDQSESLGWQGQADGTLLWGMANGVEDEEEGFILADKAPYIAPDIPSAGNGFYGVSVPLPSPDSSHAVMDCLLNRYTESEEVRCIIASLIGIQSALMLPSDTLPEGIALENGTLRFSPDIVGPSRHGKNRLLNMLLSGYGVRFQWNTSPLLSLDKGSKDSAIGRNELMATMGHHLYADADHKASPDVPEFETQHATRQSTISMFFDGPTGGVVGKQRGGKRARAVPRGGNIRTCNYDHAPYSIENQEEMIEARACTFVWPDGVIGNYEASRFFDQHRIEYYAYWQAYRRWIMCKYRMDKAAFTDSIRDWYDLAHDIASDTEVSKGEWAYEDHRNQATVIVLGIMVWQQFLLEEYPGCFMSYWLDERQDSIVAARAQRSTHIKKMVTARADKTSPDIFVVDALRSLLSSHQVYIRSQKDQVLTEPELVDLPFGMSEMGYRSDTRIVTEERARTEVEVWNSGNRAIGYLVHKKQDIAFIPGLLMDELKREADKRKIRLGSVAHIVSTLVRKGIVLPEVESKTGEINQSTQVIKIATKTIRLLVIPVAKLFAEVEIAEDGLSIDEDTTTRPHAYCSQCKRLLWVHHIEGDIILWTCRKCGKTYDPHVDMPLEEASPGNVTPFSSYRSHGTSQEVDSEPLAMDEEEVPEYVPS
jgi:hypothetical protein